VTSSDILINELLDAERRNASIANSAPTNLCLGDGPCSSTVSAVPIPATLPLFASGLAGLGLLGWRRKRKTSAAIAA